MYQLTAPTLEPVTLDEAKLSARIDGPEWDDEVTASIVEGRKLAEQLTGRKFISQVWRSELTDWPTDSDIFPIYRPSAVAVSYWNGSTWVTLTDGVGYAWGIVDLGFSVVPVLNGSFATLGDIAIGPRVRIDATAGASTAAGVDECAKRFIKAYVKCRREYPEQEPMEVAPNLARVLDPLGYVVGL